MPLKQGQIIEDDNGEKHKVLGVCGEVYFMSEGDDYDTAEGGALTESELIADGYIIPEEKWEPVDGERYWYISGTGVIDSMTWCDSYTDNKIKNFFGVFENESKAQAALAEIKAKLNK